ncbi:hypothetical protein JZU71_04880, partial [bacterium]|nr:hypothetical protein [bacterium]
NVLSVECDTSGGAPLFIAGVYLRIGIRHVRWCLRLRQRGATQRPTSQALMTQRLTVASIKRPSQFSCGMLAICLIP